jgi:hypothetical protein
MYIDHSGMNVNNPGTHGFHLVITLDNSIVEIWMRKLSYYCGPCSNNEWDDCESSN